MKERFEGDNEYGPRIPPGIDGAHAINWSRLEEVGDLHFHASNFSNAFDYYQQLLVSPQFDEIPLPDRLRLLLKATDCRLLLGHLGHAEGLLERAQELLLQNSEPQQLLINARFQVRRAVLLLESGRLNHCLLLAKKAFSVLALTDEHKDVGRLQATMGVAHYRLGRLEKAEEFYNDSLATYRRIGFDIGVANLLNNLALIKKNQCRWSTALSLMEKATSLSNQIGASHLLPGFYLNQGIILTKSNRASEARPLLKKGLGLARSLGDQLHLCRLNLALGRLEAVSHRLARSEEYLQEGKILAEQMAYPRESVIADEYLGDLLLARGQWEKALFNFNLGMKKCSTIAAGNDLEGELLRRISQAHLAAGALQDAVAVSQAALAICEKCGEAYEMGFCHLVLGKAYAQMDDTRQLDHHFREAIALFKDQHLVHQWCEAILEFSKAQLTHADEAGLLLLRRYLMDAQERGASSVSDIMLCRVLETLAKVQIELGQFDDALLSVFELERLAAGLQNDDLNQAVVRLRERIDVGLMGGSDPLGNHFQAISGIPGLLGQGDSSIPRNLESVLAAGMTRVGADCGFIAMMDDAGNGSPQLSIISRDGLTENLAQQLARWYDGKLLSDKDDDPVFFSKLRPGDELLNAVPALAPVAGSCVFMPIALNGLRFGFLFIGKRPASVLAAGFGRHDLDFLSTYMGFMALFLAEKAHHTKPSELSTPIERVASFENIITSSGRMLEVLGLAKKVAPSDLTVLLNGETGTGKGLLAYSIHALSRRAEQRFIQINCAAIPDALMESELFGHVKGAFTGAHADKMGLLESAAGGTVFLDEIGKMPLNMQGKMLQFLDTKIIRPVGGNRERLVDVRLIAASKTDLQEAAQEGRFLEDLYFRLLDFPLVIPPLRKRKDDVPLLTRHFVQRFSREIGCEIPAIDHHFMDLLTNFGWPGNVRELEKALKRAIVLAQGDGVLRAEHLPKTVVLQGGDGAGSPGAVAPLKDTLATIECREIRRALNNAGGNKSLAARLLKVSYPTLLKKIKLFGLETT